MGCLPREVECRGGSLDLRGLYQDHHQPARRARRADEGGRGMGGPAGPAGLAAVVDDETVAGVRVGLGIGLVGPEGGWPPSETRGPWFALCCLACAEWN